MLLADIPFRSGGRVSVAASEEDAKNIRAFAPGEHPVQARLASSVMLVRRGASDAERQVFMIRRAQTMAFVPGAAVFPGGGARDEDASADIAWVGPSDQAWAARLGVGDAVTARKLVVAAIRELFEEANVLLAGDEGSVVSFGSNDAGWRRDRARLEAHEVSFAEILERRGLALRTDLLAPRSRWVTPVYCPRRYDTFFFAAVTPEGQRAEALTSEAAVSDWVAPEDIVRRGDAGEVRLVPATAYNLNSLAGAASLEKFVKGERSLSALMLEPHATAAGGFDLECVLP